MGGETVFYDGVKIFELGNRAHVLKKLHGIMILCPFEEKIHEGTLWRGHIAVISFIFTRQIFLHLYRNGDRFYNLYKIKIKKGILMMVILR